MDDYQAAIRLHSKEAVYFFNQGNDECGLKRYKEAIEKYNKAIEINPHNPTYFNRRGHPKYNLKDYEGALDDYHAGIRLDSKKALYFANCADIELDLKRCEEAIESCNKAIQLNPKDGELFFLRALAYKKNGQTDKFLEDLKSGLLVDSSHSYGNYAMGRVIEKGLLEASENKDFKIYYKEAYDVYLKRISQDKNDSAAFYRLGVMNQFERGVAKNIAEAIVYYKLCVNLNGSQSEKASQKLAGLIGQFGGGIVNASAQVAQNADFKEDGEWNIKHEISKAVMK